MKIIICKTKKFIMNKIIAENGFEPLTFGL